MLALDIDGTLTNSDKLISPETKAAIREIQDRGVTIVLASGRPTPGCKRLVEELSLETRGGYLLSYNGARITDCRTGKIVFQQTLPPNIVPGLYAYALENNLGMMTYENNAVLAGTPTDAYMELEARINGLPILRHDNFLQNVPEFVNKCLMTADAEILAVHENALSGKYKDILSIYRSEPFFLEIMPSGIDKAHSLSVLLDKTGINRSELVCCGDGYNDISMLSFAGLGVAMHNAQPAVKLAADYITESNDDDGIVRVISAFFCRLTNTAA